MKIKILLLITVLMLPLMVVAKNFDNGIDEHNVALVDTEFVDAHRWMVEKNMTRFERIDDYRPYDLLTREQAAKFYATFSKDVLYEVLDMGKYCSFDDLNEADITLKNSILESCLLNLFKGSAGKFYPQRVLTKAEALTVFVRAIDGYLDETGAVWRDEYYQQAYDRGLTNVADKTTMNNSVTRYEMALLLYRAEKIAKTVQEKREQEAVTENNTVDDLLDETPNNEDESGS